MEFKIKELEAILGKKNEVIEEQEQVIVELKDSLSRWEM